MASPSSTLTPPPGQDHSPTSPSAVSPAPPQQAGDQRGTQLVISTVSNLRAIAKAYPAAAPIVAEMNEKMPELMRVIMQNQQTGEPQAPPVG